MSDLQPKGYFHNAAQNAIAQGAFRDAIDIILASLHETAFLGPFKSCLLSGTAVLSSDATVGTLIINNASPVTLASIPTTSYQDGRVIFVRPSTNGVRLTVSHGLSASQIAMEGASGWLMDSISQGLLLQLRSGLWREIGRFGKSTKTALTTTGSWSGTALYCWLEGYDCVIDGSVSSGSPVTAPSTLFNLPSGYRPNQKASFLKFTETGSPRAPFGVDVLANGDVQYVPVTSQNYPGGVQVVLSGIRFRMVV